MYNTLLCLFNKKTKLSRQEGQNWKAVYRLKICEGRNHIDGRCVNWAECREQTLMVPTLIPGEPQSQGAWGWTSCMRFTAKVWDLFMIYIYIRTQPCWTSDSERNVQTVKKNAMVSSVKCSRKIQQSENGSVLSRRQLVMWRSAVSGPWYWQ